MGGRINKESKTYSVRLSRKYYPTSFLTSSLTPFGTEGNESELKFGPGLKFFAAAKKTTSTLDPPNYKLF